MTKVGDPLYKHFLSPADYEARFGARKEDYDAVVAWAKQHNLSVGERYAGRTILTVSAPASAMQDAFQVTFHNYRDKSGKIFYAANRAPALPDVLAGKLEGVVGLSSAMHFAPHAIRLPSGTRSNGEGSGPGGAFSAADLRTIYNVPSQPFTTKTQTLAVFEQGGFDPNDVATYIKQNKLPNVPVIARSVNKYGTGIDDADVEYECVIDIDMIIGINPAAKQVLVYEDGADSFQVSLLDSLSAMATDDAAQTISISYGIDEEQEGLDAIKAENTVLMQLTAQGQSVFASSGDEGAYGSAGDSLLDVEDPASQPFVTGVGGTTLFTGKNHSYSLETVWNNLFSSIGASGGGISTVWPIPDYQAPKGQSVAAGNGGSSTSRNVPDVASVGDPLTGVAIYSKLNGGWSSAGGTSVAAPIWAGFYSLINAAYTGLGYGPAGFANPSIYTIGEGQQVFFPALNDVLDGTNGNVNEFGYGGFNAGYGYDNTTGWGSFNGGNLLAELALLPTTLDVVPPPTPRELAVKPGSTSATLTWIGSQVDTGYLVVLTDYKTSSVVSSSLTKTLSSTFGGLQSGHTYSVNVIALSKQGQTTSYANIFTTLGKTAG